MSEQAANTLNELENPSRRRALRTGVGVAAATILPTTTVTDAEAATRITSLNDLYAFLDSSNFTDDTHQPDAAHKASDAIKKKIQSVENNTKQKPVIMVSFTYAGCVDGMCQTTFMNTAHIMDKCRRDPSLPPVMHITIDITAQNAGGLKKELLEHTARFNIDKKFIDQHTVVISPPLNRSEITLDLNDSIKTGRSLQSQLSLLVTGFARKIDRPDINKVMVAIAHSSGLKFFDPNGNVLMDNKNQYTVISTDVSAIDDSIKAIRQATNVAKGTGR